MILEGSLQESLHLLLNIEDMLVYLVFCSFLQRLKVSSVSHSDESMHFFASKALVLLLLEV